MNKTKAIFILFSIVLTLSCINNVSAKDVNIASIPATSIGLTPPPEEALLVPPYEAPVKNVIVDNTMSYVVLGLLVVALSVCTVVFIKKRSGKMVKSILVIAAISASMFSTVAMNAPPVFAVDNDFGNPLDTSGIGFFCYYYYSSGFTLNDTVSAFVNVTNYGNYLDGFLSSVIKARIRADGWMLVWLDNSTEKYNIIGTSMNVAPSTANRTELAAELNTVFTAAGIATIEYYEVSYYDFEYSTTTKWVVFGKSQSSDYLYYYFHVPSSSTVTAAWYVANIGYCTNAYFQENAMSPSAGDSCTDVTAYVETDVLMTVRASGCTSSPDFWTYTMLWIA